MREDRTSTPSERTTTRSERTTRSSHISEGSPTRSTRTTRTSRQTKGTTAGETAVDSIRARREARRRRNLEHDGKQNKISVENGEVDKATKSDTEDRRRIARNKKDAEDSELPVDKHAKADDSKVIEKSRDTIDKHASKDTGDNVGDSCDLDRVEDSSPEENKSQVKEDTSDKSMTEEQDQETTKGDIKLTGIENLDEHAMVKELDAADKDYAEVEAKMSEASSDDSSSRNKQRKGERPMSVESDRIDNSKTAGLSVTGGENQDEVHSENNTEEIRHVFEIEDDSEVKRMEDTVDKKGKEDEESPKTGGKQDNEPIGTGENVEVTTIADELPKTKEGGGISDISTTENRQTSDMPASDESDVEVKVVEQTLENSPLESVPYETVSTKEIAGADNRSVGDGTSAPDKGQVILEELPEMPLVLDGEITADKSSIPADGKAGENELTKDEASFASEEVAIQLESSVDGVPQGSEKMPDDLSHEVTEEQKIVSPHTSPRKSKLKAKSDDADTKSSKTRMKSESEMKNERLRAKSDISRTKSSDVGTKTDEVETNKTKPSAKSDLNRTKSAESGTKATESETKTDNVSTKRDIARSKSAETAGKANDDKPKTDDVGAKTSRVGKLKVSDDAWKKNVRKKRGVPDVDRAAELMALGRTGKIKDKMKGCEGRDVQSAEQCKREVKKGSRKHKSFDEETEKELRELSSKRELKNIVQSCEEKDMESADTWKREVS